MATVVLLVVLRLSLGCHFFYEGVWKIENADEFSAEPFLTQAKGPAAPLFYAMVPDLDGRERLKVEPLAAGDPLTVRWSKARDDAEERLAKALKDSKTTGQASAEAIRVFNEASLKALWQAEDELAAYLASEQDAMLAYADAGTKPTDETKQIVARIGQIERDYYDALASLFKECAKADPPGFAKVVVKEDLPLEKVVSFREGIRGETYLDDWSKLKAKIDAKYALAPEQEFELEKTFRRYQDSLRQYLDENEEDIAAYFGSLERLDERKAAGANGAAHEQARLWDQQQKLRGEVRKWLGDLGRMQDDFGAAAWQILSEDQRDLGDLPKLWTLGDLIDLAVTWGLTAIGFCLLLGLFTRPAALGGAAFLTFVLLTQPPWPTIYPPAPAVVGHALLVDKNFIELVALLVIASCAAGRWAGLDYFVEHIVVGIARKCPCLKCCCGAGEGNEAACDESADGRRKPNTKKEGA